MRTVSTSPGLSASLRTSLKLGDPQGEPGDGEHQDPFPVPLHDGNHVTHSKRSGLKGHAVFSLNLGERA